MLDLVLAIIHHFLAFGIVAGLLAEAVLLRPGMPPSDIPRIARLDMGYGITAGLIVVVGILRVIFGAKAAQYYLGNPWFWAKMVSFAAAGLLSIQPTRKILVWRKAYEANPGFLPSDMDFQSVSRLMRLQRLCLFLVIAFAATMARYT